MKICAIAIIGILMVLLGCAKEAVELADPYENLSGVKFGEWYISSKYTNKVIDVYNYDGINRTVRVTTLCFDKNNTEIPSNDSEVLTIPAKSFWTWKPVCPKEAKNQDVSLEVI